MPGPAPSPDDERTRRNAPTKTVIDVVVHPAVEAGVVPDAPANLRTALRTDWRDLWLSPVAALITDTDLPALRRLWELRELHAQYLDELGGGNLFAAGSQGQTVANPALAAAMSIEKSITALEDRFALTLKARQNAGLRMGALADVARRHPELTDKEPTARADPRFTDAQPSAPDPRAVGGGLDGSEPRPRRGRQGG